MTYFWNDEMTFFWTAEMTSSWNDEMASFWSTEMASLRIAKTTFFWVNEMHFSILHQERGRQNRNILAPRSLPDAIALLSRFIWE